MRVQRSTAGWEETSFVPSESVGFKKREAAVPFQNENMGTGQGRKAGWRLWSGGGVGGSAIFSAVHYWSLYRKWDKR